MQPLQWKDVIPPQSKQKPQSPLLVHYTEELTRAVNTTLVALHLRLFKGAFNDLPKSDSMVWASPRNFLLSAKWRNCFQIPRQFNRLGETHQNADVTKQGKTSYVALYSAIPSSTNSLQARLWHKLPVSMIMLRQHVTAPATTSTLLAFAQHSDDSSRCRRP